MLCLVRATVATADWKVYTTLSPWVPLSPQPQLNVQWDALALTIKWNGDTDAVKILLYVFIFLCGVVLDGENRNSATQDSSGRGPSWTQVQRVLSAQLWAFLSTALWRVSGNINTQGIKESRWLGVVTRKQVLWPPLAPPGSSEPELVEVGSRQRECREGTSSVGILGRKLFWLFREWDSFK